MEQSQDTARQLANVASNFANMYQPDAASKIEKAISAAYGDFKPEYQELSNLQAQTPTMVGQMTQDYLPTMQGRVGYTPGALSNLQTAIGNTGQHMANIGYLGNLLSQKQGRAEDLASNALSAYQSGMQMYPQMYNMLTPLYQSQLSTEQAAAERAWQEAQTLAAQQYQAEQDQIARDFQAQQNALSRASSGGGGTSYTPPTSGEIEAWLASLNQQQAPESEFEVIDIPDLGGIPGVTSGGSAGLGGGTPSSRSPLVPNSPLQPQTSQTYVQKLLSQYM